MDGKEELADLDAENPKRAFLTVAKTSVLQAQVHPYYLSDEDIAGYHQMALVIFSRI